MCYMKSIHSQSLNLFIAQHIVNQTRQDVSGGISYKTDCVTDHSVHTLLAIAEHVLHPGSR